MIFIWRGMGWLVVAVPWLVFAALAVVLGLMPPGRVSGITMFGTTSLVSAALIWWLGRKLNRVRVEKVDARARLIEDVRAGSPEIFHNTHTLYWIPMQWWAIPFAVGGLLGLFFGFSGHR